MNLKTITAIFSIFLVLATCTPIISAWKPEIHFTSSTDNLAVGHFHAFRTNEQISSNQFTITAATFHSSSQVNYQKPGDSIDINFNVGIKKGSPVIPKDSEGNPRIVPEITASIFEIELPRPGSKIVAQSKFAVHEDIKLSYTVSDSSSSKIRYAFKGFLVRKKTAKLGTAYSLQFKIPLYLAKGRRYTIMLAVTDNDRTANPPVPMTLFNQRYLFPVSSYLYYYGPQADFLLGPIDKSTEQTPPVSEKSFFSMFSSFFGKADPKSVSSKETAIEAKNPKAPKDLTTGVESNAQTQTTDPFPPRFNRDVLRFIFGIVDDPLQICRFCRASKTLRNWCDATLVSTEAYLTGAEFCGPLARVEKMVQLLESQFISQYELARSSHVQQFQSYAVSRQKYLDYMKIRLKAVVKNLVGSYRYVRDDVQVVAFSTIEQLQTLVKRISEFAGSLELKEESLQLMANAYYTQNFNGNQFDEEAAREELVGEYLSTFRQQAGQTRQFQLWTLPYGEDAERLIALFNYWGF